MQARVWLRVPQLPKLRNRPQSLASLLVATILNSRTKKEKLHIQQSDPQTPSKHLFQANLSSSRGWDFLRGWMSLRVRGKRSSKGVDEEEGDEEDEGEGVEIDGVMKGEEKLGAEEEQMRRCDVITINGKVGFLQKVSTDV